MAPAPAAWFLLDSYVDLDFDGEDDGPAAAAVEAVASKTPDLLQRLADTAIALLGTLKPAADLVAPPEISTLRLLGSKSHRLSHHVGTKCRVACAANNLIVLYGGSYSYGCGCYIVLDAAAAAAGSPRRPLLSTVPPLLRASCSSNFGSSTVALRRQPPSSAYLLAELIAKPKRDHLPDAVLHLWRSDDAPGGQWVSKKVRLPAEFRWVDDPDKQNLTIDTAFSVPGTGTLCWVDLVHGIVVCGNPEADDPSFRFVPFPEDCPAVGMSYDEDRPYGFRPRMDEFRSAACVGGAVRLVAVVGPLEGRSPDEFELATWTLSPDLQAWRRDGAFRIKDLRATQEYSALGLEVAPATGQEHVPAYPVLSLLGRRSCSPEEEEAEAVVVYALFNKLSVRTISPTKSWWCAAPRTEYELECQYVVGIDVRRNKIVSTSSRVTRSAALTMPGLRATEFSCGASSLRCAD